MNSVTKPKIPFSQFQKGYKHIDRFAYPVYLSLLGLISSVPIWIWLGWSIAWKVCLTSFFLFLVTNGAHNMLKKSYYQYKHELDKNDQIDYTK